MVDSVYVVVIVVVNFIVDDDYEEFPPREVIAAVVFVDVIFCLLTTCFFYCCYAGDSVCWLSFASNISDQGSTPGSILHSSDVIRLWSQGLRC